MSCTVPLAIFATLRMFPDIVYLGENRCCDMLFGTNVVLVESQSLGKGFAGSNGIKDSESSTSL
jgi:hypothetical protein